MRLCSSPAIHESRAACTDLACAACEKLPRYDEVCCVSRQLPQLGSREQGFSKTPRYSGLPGSTSPPETSLSPCPQVQWNRVSFPYGARPNLGRAFVPEEDQPGRNKVIVLSYDLWQTRFGSDPHVLARTVNLNGSSYTVIGVIGPKLRRPDWAKMWTPPAMTDQKRAVRDEHHYLSSAGAAIPGGR